MVLKQEFIRDWLIISACVIFGIGLYVFIYPRLINIGTDGTSYSWLAESIAMGKGLTIFGQPHLYFSPLLAIFIAPFYLIIRNSELAGHITILTFMLVSLPIFYYLLRLISNWRVATIGTVLLISNGAWWLVSAIIVPQLLIGFFLLLLLLALVKFSRLETYSPHKILYYLAFGLISGLAYLTRPEYVFSLIPVILFVWLINGKQKLKENILATVVMVVIFCLVATPYVIFLHQHTGQWTFTGRITSQLSLALSPIDTVDIVNPPVVGVSILPTILENLPQLFKFFLKNIYDIEKAIQRMFGVIGLAFIGLGVRYLILQGKKKELLAILVPLSFILLLAVGHAGGNGYASPFIFLFVILIATGCYSFLNEINEFLKLSAVKKKTLSMFVVGIVALYSLFPLIQSYLFLPKDFTAVEFKMLGQWFKSNVPEYSQKSLASRNPEIAYYSGTIWVPVDETQTLSQVVELMRARNAQYLALDSRNLAENLTKFTNAANSPAFSRVLQMVKEFDYYTQRIYLYRLIK